MDKLPIVYSLPGMEGCQVRRDICYRSPQQPDLTLDLYRPAESSPTSPLPAVVLVHGGPTHPQLRLPKDWAAFQCYGQLLAACGLAGIAFNYRHAADTPWETSAGDIAAAIDYLAANRAGLGLDGGRLCAWFFSGGGRFLPTVLERGQGWLDRLVLYYPLLEFPAAQDEAACHPAFSLPILVARAGKDSPRLNRALDRFIQRARAAAAPLELIDYAQGHHGFDLFDDHPSSRQIIARTLAFIQSPTL